MVTQNGVPISSCRLYIFPILPPLSNSATKRSFNFFLAVAIRKQYSHQPRQSKRRLNHMGNVFFTGYMIPVAQILSRMFAVVSQVKISSVCNAKNLLPPERILIFNIHSLFGIMRAFKWLMLPPPQVFFRDTKLAGEVPHFALPILIRLLPPRGMNKIFKFHEVKFQRAVNKLPHGDFVAKSLSLLCNTKRNPHTHRIKNIFEIEKNSLRDFTAQICL